MTQSFAKVALTPKWIGALLAALAVAAIFALLGQWQLGRALHTTTPITPKPQIALETLTKPGEAFKTDWTSRKVSIEIKSAIYVGQVANRVQTLSNNETQEGYWSIALAELQTGGQAVIAYDFTKEPTNPTTLEPGVYEGNYLPSEEPIATTTKTFESLSVQQVINLDQLKPKPTFTGFIALSNGPGNPIAFANQETKTEINVLNAFYAAEWALFAGFAVFLWWRLVQDERLGLRNPN